MENAEIRVALSDVSEGGKVKVVGFSNVGAGFTRRLQEMGVLPGETVNIVRNASYGPVEIRVKGSNLLIGRGIARKVIVEVIDE